MMVTSTHLLSVCLLMVPYTQDNVIVSARVTAGIERIPNTPEKLDLETKVEQHANENLSNEMKPGLSKTATSVEVSCPPPFTRVMEECFYVHVAHRLTWWEALGFCLDMGGHLAQPTRLTALQAVILQNYRNGPHHFWLGASDLKKEGEFRWLSGALVESGWRDGQPDDATDGEDCLEMWPLKYPSLNDRNCHNAEAFVCQY